MDNRKLLGRKLILNWGNLKVEISKLPYGNGQKDSVFDLVGSDVVLANVYEGEDGKIVDEVLGTPAGMNGDGTCLEGRLIRDYFTRDEFWMTISEAQGKIVNCRVAKDDAASMG